MANILLISKNTDILDEISSVLIEYNIFAETFLHTSEDETVNFIMENNFSIIIMDGEIKEYDLISKKIKSNDLTKDIFLTLLYNSNSFNQAEGDLSGFIDAFIQKPVLKNVLISTINSCLKIKKNIEKFKKDNKELNRSLYQLDVLYNTSSKLSGNLDKDRLFEIMFETLEKTLSFDLACALIYDKPQNTFVVHSLKKPDENLLSILKEKISSLVLENKGENIMENSSEIKIEEHIRPSYTAQNYDLKLLNFDKLSAPIKVKDETYALILIYRENPFSKEDVVCFQSISHQISSALRAIILYNEIKNTNMELKKLERIKSEFISIVSHELRTPLTPMNLSLDFLSSCSLDENAKKSVEMAKRNVTRLTGMIEDLLDLSRIETGKFKFDYKKYNIKTSLDLVNRTFEEQAKNKNIKFDIIQDEILPDIYADPKRIDQILTNITNNAMKFTQNNGQITILAKTISSDDIKKQNLISPIDIPEGQYIHISIKDTGLGIKDENISKIFNKFSQIENSLTRNAGGIGLGLTITKNFIDAHLGFIWVTSKENEGSDFNVVIPVYSDFKAFLISLNESKKTTDSTSLLTIKSNGNLENFINVLKEENIIKALKNSKEIFYKEDALLKDGNQTPAFVYKIYFKNLQKSALDFMTSQINDKINKIKNGPEGQSHAIVLEKIVFKKENEEL